MKYSFITSIVAALVLSFAGVSQARYPILRLSNPEHLEVFGAVLRDNNIKLTRDDIDEVVSIIQTVEEGGIRVLFDANETDTCAFVEGDKMVFNLPTLDPRKCGSLLETFRHETFHLVQICVGGGDAKPIGMRVSQSSIRRVEQSDYDESVKELEAEAFESEKYPNASVNMLHSCLSGELK